MISLLVEPAMLLIRKHLALAGLNVDKSTVIEAKGLNSEDYMDKFLKGAKTAGILYERGKIIKTALSSKPITVHLEKDGKHFKRKATSCIVPFNIAVVSNQILDLDNYELLHVMELSTTQFSFQLSVPELKEQGVNTLQYAVTYAKLDEKANEKLLIRELGNGFYEYKFAIHVEGYLLAPYTTAVNIVSDIIFEMHIGEIKSEDNIAFTLTLPKE